MKTIARLAIMAWLGFVTTGCQHIADSHPQGSLHVMTFNIHHGRGLDGEVNLERIAALINAEEADLVALQEVDKGTQRTEQLDIAAELARLTGMHFVFERNIDFQGGEYGNAILSRHPIINSRNHHYKMLRDGEQRGLLSAEVRFNNRTFTFAATHLDHRPDPSERISNLKEIRAFVEELDHPVILAGDFNDYPGGTVHNELTTLFTDSWAAAGRGNGFTFSSSTPKSRIDYIYFSPTNAWEVSSARVIASEASDHLPLAVELISRD